MMNRSLYTLRTGRQALLLAMALILLVGTVGCSRQPRKHWWQFWRPKATETSQVYQPGSVLPPPPDVLDSNGSGQPLPAEGGTLPPPPTGTGEMSEPNPMRQPAQATSALRTVFFEFDSADITAEAQAVLDGNAAWLQANAGDQIQIEGHTDERGTTEYNMNLGDRRAKAVKAYLVSRGIDANRLHTISYGEERPVDPGQDEAAWAKNRRAQFLVY